MFVLKNLVSNEFFPKELPPCFTTNLIGDVLSDEELNKLGETKFRDKDSSPVIFSGYKSESSRRRFAIPNFINYVKLAKLISDNSDDIFNILKKTCDSSLSAPVNKEPNSDEPYHKAVQSFHDSGIEIEKLYYNNKYELYLDISSFFDNIYTHSIAWAVEGKNVAKANHSLNLLGNKLDKLVRVMNRNQTNGILIGNALSRIISEIILCNIDGLIHKDLPNLKYKRFVDDYYIFTEKGYDIPNILSTIRKHLNTYELTINENKMQIIESPFVFGKPWIERIRENIHLDPLIFLNHIIIEYKKYKDVSLLRYGLKVISLYEYSKDSWRIMESKIFNLLATFPSLADIILKILIHNKKNINKILLKQTVYTIIDNVISLSFDQELIWMAWYTKVFMISISIEYVKKILKSNNSLASIILLDYIKNEKSEIYNNIDIVNCRKSMVGIMNSKESIMESEFWLIAYEGTIDGWFDFNDSKFEIINSNTHFKTILDKGFRFYNSDYQYDLEEAKRPMYITREEVVKKFNELKSIIINSKCLSDKQSDELLKIEFEKFEKVIALNEY